MSSNDDFLKYHVCEANISIIKRILRHLYAFSLDLRPGSTMEEIQSFHPTRHPYMEEGEFQIFFS